MTHMPDVIRLYFPLKEWQGNCMKDGAEKWGKIINHERWQAYERLTWGINFNSMSIKRLDDFEEEEEEEGGGDEEEEF
jgi:hypothetical protein